MIPNLTPREIMERYQGGTICAQTAIKLLREHASKCSACSDVIHADYIPGIALWLPAGVTA